ncbi:hypothetical protein EVAR_17588_1 [Eumeta japonica]|uniref:Uncharacterized protein n=1 Tax=Eumeta variegata TaxID=151549 RepID=A0A4C1UC78_EUMVA|nr:hypothetical protein EVAR_17588_1 [Eumeta japonica]
MEAHKYKQTHTKPTELNETTAGAERGIDRVDERAERGATGDSGAGERGAPHKLGCEPLRRSCCWRRSADPSHKLGLERLMLNFLSLNRRLDSGGRYRTASAADELLLRRTRCGDRPTPTPTPGPDPRYRSVVIMNLVSGVCVSLYFTAIQMAALHCRCEIVDSRM